jgi:hypothetical protein
MYIRKTLSTLVAGSCPLEINLHNTPSGVDVGYARIFGGKTGRVRLRAEIIKPGSRLSQRRTGLAATEHLIGDLVNRHPIGYATQNRIPCGRCKLGTF